MHALFRWPSLDAARGWAHEPHAETADGAAAIALISPVVTPSAPFHEAIPSWGATTPGTGWIEVALRVQRTGCWSRWYRMARWDDRLEASTRRSFDSQRDDDGRVATDTFVASAPSEAVQARVLLVGMPAPIIRSFALALSAPGEPALPAALPEIAEIAVPLRSQLIYPNGGDGWCSPTCVAMVLAYWHARTGDHALAGFDDLRAIPDRVVKLVYDPSYAGTGNWIFNTAAAASFGLESAVARFASLRDLVPWLQAGVPVIISLAWQPGELVNAPIPKSSGHLIVVTGFAGGDVLVADPAGQDATQVRRSYNAVQLETAWQRSSNGTVYLMFPPDWPV